MIHTLFFHFTHRPFCFWLKVVVSQKVQDAVDKIKLSFFIRRVGVVKERCFRRDEDVAQIGSIDRKCDAIGRSRIIEKFLMELDEFSLGNEINRDFFAMDRKKCT